ncbi:MAG: methyl-viologen-reducing hydrogenase subunit delta [Chloroflexi bacterium RBG_16_57_11]|nr:MAG: methyl-viologen-reducing hydrogenase subunit delta [Chloroflexi bacterium RBG_16_57_11]
MDLIYEPVIVGFLCNWCSYRAADLAGTARLHYAPNMRAIRVMCSGRVEPDLVLKALREGADGVLIAGCHPGECHYIEGNLKALRRYTLLKRVLVQFGIEEQRVQIVWASASEGPLLAKTVDRMTEELRLLGPLRWHEKVLHNGHHPAQTHHIPDELPTRMEV